MLIRSTLTAVLFVSVAHATTNGIKSAWKGFSSPEIIAAGYTPTMAALPLEAHLDNGTKGWSSSYWPSMQGGINVRWNSPSKEGFDYASPTKEQVAKMSLAELALLSPSEKYDILVGQYNYPLKKLVYKSVSQRAPDWAGICHGWAPASTHHSEPTPKVVTNIDGIQVPFGTADITGLLSYFYAREYEHEDGINQVGRRCTFGSWLGGTKACDEDLNAGAFHIIMTNLIGLQNKGFMIDVDRYKEVWNQPVYGYKSVILEDNLPVSPGAASSAVKEMLVATDFTYVDESDNLTWDVVYGTKEQMLATKKYAYRLEINAAGNIVGGVWLSAERPDFLWNKPKAEMFTGILSQLPLLLND